MAAGLRLICLFAAFSLVLGDCYLHMPRGSNNRLNERSANRNNANRMFDSQNNNRGGYNAGDTDDQNGFNQEDQIYYMKYYQSGAAEDVPSFLTIEWTNQHACGGNENDDPHKPNCNLVIQYMVQDYDGDQAVMENEKLTRLRNGVNTGTQNYQSGQNNENYAAFMTRRDNNVQVSRGLHETFDYYDDCYFRERNQGLFTADQRLRSNNRGISSAIYTRQNPNGNRRGYECPEERDYYPYWHPTPWRDIAVLTDNVTLCNRIYSESFNVVPRQICRENFTTGQAKSWSQYNNEEECTQNGGVWYTEYAYIDYDRDITTPAACAARNNEDGYRRVWAKPTYYDTMYRCLILPGPPECIQASWSRDNHLGNGRDGVPLNYTWKIPYFPSQTNKLAVVRIRYNISTDDYHPWLTDSSFNENRATGRRSPVEQNPNVNIGSTTNKPLRLAINTAQFGRTFQDRSHVMELRPRSELPQEGQECRLHNLNIRGKRGNIVQVYPSVEYDFIPNRLNIDSGDCIHVQWTGSNTHNNGNPGGDGQTGDAGEGRGGTDRNNIVQVLDPNTNYPVPWENATLFKDAEVIWASFADVPNNPSELSIQDVATAFASSGYYRCVQSTTCTDSVQTKATLQQLLNNASPSFEGAILRFTRRGTYYYICSRNNNFTNRSQKGQLTVS